MDLFWQATCDLLSPVCPLNSERYILIQNQIYVIMFPSCKQYDAKNALKCMDISRKCLTKGSLFWLKFSLLKGGVRKSQVAHPYTKIHGEPPPPRVQYKAYIVLWQKASNLVLLFCICAENSPEICMIGCSEYSEQFQNISQPLEFRRKRLWYCILFNLVATSQYQIVQYSIKMHQIVTTRLNNLQYHSLLCLNSVDCVTRLLASQQPEILSISITLFTT